MFRPNRQFQSGLDPKDARRQREKNSLSLRRKDRELKLQKKRKKILNERTENEKKSIEGENEQNKLLVQLPQLVRGCFTSHKATIFECTQKIRQLLSFTCSAPIAQVIESGIVSRLIQFLRWNHCQELQFEALWILTNMASSEKAEHTAYIVRNGAVSAFIDILLIPNYSLQEQCIWALGNLAGDCIEIRNMLLQQNVLVNILKICQSKCDQTYKLKKYGTETELEANVDANTQFLSLLQNVSWAISNLCRYGAHSSQNVSQLLQCLFHLLQHAQHTQTNNIYTLTANIGWSFSYLLTDVNDNDHDIDLLNIMNTTGITKALIMLLSPPHNISTQRSVLRAVGNILTANYKYTQICIQYGILPLLYQLLIFTQTHSNDMTLKELCWAISNITAGTKQQIEAVMEQNIFPILVAILSNGRSFVATEALWAISNATNESHPDIIQHLLDHGVIKALCVFLTTKFGPNTPWHMSYNKILLVALECVQNLLNGSDTKYEIEFEANGGLDYLQFIQSHDNISQEIFDKASDIATLNVANQYSELHKQNDTKFDFDAAFENKVGFNF